MYMWLGTWAVCRKVACEKEGFEAIVRVSEIELPYLVRRNREVDITFIIGHAAAIHIEQKEDKILKILSS
jgi:hypothetical protein